MYRYYIEVNSEKHYPYANEVADALYANYGIASATDPTKPAKSLVVAALNWVHENEDKLFYNTRHGLKRVYPLWSMAFQLLIDNCVQESGTVKIGGKNYRYTKHKRNILSQK